MTDSERLKLVIEWSKTTPNEFAKSLGYERAMTIYNVLNEKTPISVKLCANICKQYPAINYQWILKGAGEMILQSDYNQKNTDQTIDETNINPNYKHKTTTEMKHLSNEERIDRLLDQNDKLISMLQTQVNTINNLSVKVKEERSMGEASGRRAI